MTSVKLGELVASNVRAEFARRRLGASDLAPVLGVALRQAQRRLSGDTPFSLDEVADVAAYLEIDLTILVSAPLSARDAA